MELMISSKGSKYIVEDKEQKRIIYTVKKKGFGAGRYLLMDPSNYQLYSLVQTSADRKPSFIIGHNDSTIMQLVCTSLFLEPSISVTGKDIQGVEAKYSIASKDHRNFDILKDDVKCGTLRTNNTVSNELQYDLDIDNKVFDDYIPLFVIAVDLTFGDINRNNS
ncbi:MAG: hypothetical protein K2N49_00955 [Ruminococcus sp.]|nr:hypothetical protein [Ruminococcus sp.]MDE7225422.1 hypothetical protein [Ruminococcus sp.]